MDALGEPGGASVVVPVRDAVETGMRTLPASLRADPDIASENSLANYFPALVGERSDGKDSNSRFDRIFGPMGYVSFAEVEDWAKKGHR